MFFLLFGEYKVIDSRFARTGFAQYIQGFVDNGAVSFYKPLLIHVALAHPFFWGYAIGIIELFIGISLLLGIWVRPASVVGILLMANLTLATWWESGHGVAVWRYFGAELDHLPLLMLFVIFFAADAGKVWGLDRRRA